MEITINQAMLDALLRAGHVPDDLKLRFDAIQPVAGGDASSFLLKLSEDEAVELSELLQWHVRTDPATGRPTQDTAPYAAIIQTIAEAQF